MRILMWLSIGFGAACALCAYLLPVGWIPSLAFVLLAVSLAGFRCSWFRRASTALLGCVLGLIWFACFHRVYLLPAAALDGTAIETTVTATDYGYDTTYGTAVDGRVEVEGRQYQIRVYLSDKQEISPGDQIKGSFRCRFTAPDDAETSMYHPGKGIFLLGYQTDTVELLRAMKTDILQYTAILRSKIRDALRTCFPEDVFPFVQALLLGDGSELDYETDTAFKISGIRHIIAVSGLHVSILYGLLSTLTLRRRYLTALITMPVLFLFAAVAGFTPSVTRACIMVGLMVLAQTFQREYDSPTALGFASLVMLIVNPLVITSVSFQLSVGCVAGILLFNEPIRAWLMGYFGECKGKNLKASLIRWFTGSVSVTLSAMSITTPLSAIYFGAVSLIGVVTNLLTLWIVNLIFNGIIVTCVLSLISIKTAALLGRVLAWPVRFVLGTAKLLAKFPLAAVYTRSVYIVCWLIFVYVLLIVLLLQRKRLPWQMIAWAVVGLGAALLASWLEPLTDHSRVTVLDVGQGQSILLQTEGRTYLVDCGGDSDGETADIVAETLLTQGIQRLDGIILTHMDRDHAGAMENLLTRIETDLILFPATAEDASFDTSGMVVPVSKDMKLTFGGAVINIYGPLFMEESNENSLCVLFSTEKCDILITGDRSGFGEQMLLRRADLPDVDVLIAGHHGSKYSTSEELLQAVRPEIVIISVGEDNRYGHPAPELLERLEDFGCAVYRTDENGTIYYRR